MVVKDQREHGGGNWLTVIMAALTAAPGIAYLSINFAEIVITSMGHWLGVSAALTYTIWRNPECEVVAPRAVD